MKVSFGEYCFVGDICTRVCTSARACKSARVCTSARACRYLCKALPTKGTLKGCKQIPETRKGDMSHVAGKKRKSGEDYYSQEVRTLSMNICKYEQTKK